MKKTQDEEVKQIDEERTKQIYKNWKEDSEWQASCKYPEAPNSGTNQLVHLIIWRSGEHLEWLFRDIFNTKLLLKGYGPPFELQKGSQLIFVPATLWDI